jgi:hypothetical protein
MSTATVHGMSAENQITLSSALDYICINTAGDVIVDTSYKWMEGSRLSLTLFIISMTL